MATILIVDDDAVNRSILIALLTPHRHHLLEAADGAVALDMARRISPDLVIADILMPQMDGYEFVHRLRADPRIAHTRVLFYTATYLDFEARALAEACGVIQILAKPAEAETLLRTVTYALAQPAAQGDEAPTLGFDRQHTQLLTNKLAEKVYELERANRHLAMLVDESHRHSAALEQEVADRAHAEDSLRESEERFRKLFEASPVGIVALDQQSRIALVNPALEMIFGYSASELAGLPLSWLLPEYQDGGAPQLLGYAEPGAAAQPAHQSKDLIGRHKNGELRIIEARFSHLRLDGQICTVAFVSDTTERRQAEDLSRRYMQRLTTLHSIDQSILVLQSPQTIAETALVHMRELIPCSCVCIIDVDRTTDELISWAVEAQSSASLVAGQRILQAEFPGIDALSQRQSAIIDDLMAMAECSAFIRRLCDDGIRALLSIPLVAQGQLIGILSLFADAPAAFLPEHEAVAREIGDQIAVAIQNARLFEQVREGRERLQQLSRELVRAQEDERRHLARELHDEIGQSLTAVQLNLQALLKLSDQQAIPARIEDSMALIDRVLQQVRALSLDLRPALLDDLGLVAALRWYVSRQAARAGLQVDFHAEPASLSLSSELETTCFRVAQEAFTNIARHAQAQRVWVVLRRHDTELQLQISDDGRGFHVARERERAAQGTSLGLLGMQERALQIGGAVLITSAPGQGTQICARFPLFDAAEHMQRIERRKVRR